MTICVQPSHRKETQYLKRKRAITSQIQRHKIQRFNTVSILRYVINTYVPL